MKNLLFLFITIFPAIILNGQTEKSPDREIVKTTYTYKEVDDVKIKADLYKFKDEHSLKPAIIWLHGGALIWGSRDRLPQEQMEFYLNAGYSVISIDYRLAPETKLLDIVKDIKDAVTWVRENGEKTLGIDSDKIFVVGHSAGGYLALMTGYILERPPQAIISFYGYGDIAADWYNKPDPFYSTWDTIEKERAFQLVGDSPITSASYSDRFDFYLYCRQNGFWTKNVSGIDPLKEPDKLKYYCPLRNIHPEYPPTLLIHGAQDTDVPILQSKLMMQELTKNKIENKMITMSEYGHVFDIAEGGLSNKDIRKIFEDVVDFLDKHKESQAKPDSENETKINSYSHDELNYGTNKIAGRYAKTEDASIYYEVYGKGRPVVLLHGGFAYIDQFKDYIPILSKKYKVIAIATRGYGKSEIGTKRYSYDLFADDVKAVIRKESQDKAIIIGFSDGARTAFVFASKYPEITYKVVTMGGGSLGTSGYTQKGFDWLENFNSEEFEYYRPDFKKIMPKPERWSDFIANLKIIWSEKDILPLENLKNITCPFLILAADRDEFNKLERLVEVYQRIPNAQLAVFLNSTHLNVSPMNIEILEKYILKFIE